MGEWELEVDEDIVLILGDLTACVEGTGTGSKTGNRKDNTSTDSIIAKCHYCWLL